MIGMIGSGFTPEPIDFAPEDAALFDGRCPGCGMREVPCACDDEGVPFNETNHNGDDE